MTGELVPLKRREVVDTRASLDVLAKIASAEHDAAQQAMGSVIEHSIRAGEALLLAKEKLDAEGKKVPWQQWVADNYSGRLRAELYRWAIPYLEGPQDADEAKAYARRLRTLAGVVEAEPDGRTEP